MRRNFYPVILSEAKNLVTFSGKILRFAQNDKKRKFLFANYFFQEKALAEEMIYGP